jgi:hypothetical protein
VERAEGKEALLAAKVSSTHAHLAQPQKTCLDSGLHMTRRRIAEVAPARRLIPPPGPHAEQRRNQHRAKAGS